MEKHFKDRKQASDFVDDVYKGLTRRHGQNAIPQNVKEECFRQYRRHLWLGIERRQDELVERLTAGQVNLMAGSRYPKPANLPEPIGWAISNNVPGDVLVDTAGCPIHGFKLPPNFDGSMAPMLQQGAPITGDGKVNRALGAFDLSAFKAGLREKGSEGEIPYLYLDNEGNVTVGIGHLIPNFKEALSQDFVIAAEGQDTDAEVRTATQQQIETAYNQLVAHRDELNGGFERGAVKYREYSFIEDEQGQRVQVKLKRSGAEIQMHLDVDAGFKQLNRMTTSFPNFSTYPSGAKYALLDMIFNMGKGKFEDEFLRSDNVFGPAVQIRNWHLAAAASHRRTKNEARNNATRDHLLAAAQLEPFFHDPGCTMARRLDEWTVPGFL